MLIIVVPWFLIAMLTPGLGISDFDGYKLQLNADKFH